MIGIIATSNVWLERSRNDIVFLTTKISSDKQQRAPDCDTASDA
jgi:hypothetical protein